MRRIGLVALLLTFALSSAAMAESACHSQAIGKNGKPLAGAALNSFMTKCTREACEPESNQQRWKGTRWRGENELYEEMPERSLIANRVSSISTCPCPWCQLSSAIAYETLRRHLCASMA